MTAKEIIDVISFIPSPLLNMGLAVIILSLIQITPIKVNPWTWLKQIYHIPDKIADLETELAKTKRDLNDDRAYRWRSQILSRADHVRRGEKLSEERWNDTIESIDLYEIYCEKMEKEGSSHFANGKCKVAIAYLKEKYKEVYAIQDYLEEVKIS